MIDDEDLTAETPSEPQPVQSQTEPAATSVVTSSRIAAEMPDPLENPSEKVAAGSQDREGQNETSPSVFVDASIELKPLDRRWMSLSRIINFIWASIVGLIGVSVCVGSLITVDESWRWWTLGLLPLLSVVFYLSWTLPRLRYERWSYSISENVIILRHGILWQATQAIPISRLQHVDLHTGPLERRFGLATVELHTAGTHSANHPIPGLDRETAAQLRDSLAQSVSNFKLGNTTRLESERVDADKDEPTSDVTVLGVDQVIEEVQEKATSDGETDVVVSE